MALVQGLAGGDYLAGSGVCVCIYDAGWRMSRNGWRSMSYAAMFGAAVWAAVIYMMLTITWW